MTDLVAVGDRIEALLDLASASPDPRSAERSEELVRLVTDLYGAGLARIMELVGELAPEAADRLAADELVASLLLVHGLHPADLAGRVEEALESVRPLLGAHGGDVALLDVDGDVGAVRLRLLGSCDGCPSSASTLRHAVEEAIIRAAPEVLVIDVDQPSDDPHLDDPLDPSLPSPAGAGAPSGAAVPVALTTKPTFDTCPAEPVPS